MQVNQNGIDRALNERMKIEERCKEIEALVTIRENELHEIIEQQQEDIETKNSELIDYKQKLDESLDTSNANIDMLKEIIHDERKEKNIVISQLREDINSRQVKLNKAHEQIVNLHREIELILQDSEQTNAEKIEFKEVDESIKDTKHDKWSQTDNNVSITDPWYSKNCFVLVTLTVVLFALILTYLH